MKIYTKSQIDDIIERIDILEQRIIDQKIYLNNRIIYHTPLHIY